MENGVEGRGRGVGETEGWAPSGVTVIQDNSDSNI